MDCPPSADTNSPARARASCAVDTAKPHPPPSPAVGTAAEGGKLEQVVFGAGTSLAAFGGGSPASSPLTSRITFGRLAGAWRRPAPSSDNETHILTVYGLALCGLFHCGPLERHIQLTLRSGG